MAVISSYNTLQTAVGDYLARSDLATFIPNFIQNWEEAFYRQPRNYGRWMEAELSLTTASGVAAMPADYLKLKYAKVSGSSVMLEQSTITALYRMFPRSVGGTPKWMARSENSFVFGPVPGDGTVIEGVYYAKPDLLRNDADGINWLMTNAPDLVLFGTLAHAEPFLKNDGRIALWRDFYADALVDYRDHWVEEDKSGGPLQVVAM